MKYLKFFAIAILLWFPVVFGMAWSAEILRIPDTELWLWVFRIAAVGLVACIAWLIVGARHATAIAQSILNVIGIISNILFAVCIIFGVAAVVMVFIKDYKWLTDNLYQPYIARALGICLVSVGPLVLLLMIFRQTRALGGISLYLLTYFFGFSLWFYSLIYAASSGTGWVIGGLVGAGVGIVPMAMIAAAVWGQWIVAGEILLSIVLIWVARMFGMAVAAKQLEKENQENAFAKYGLMQ